MVSNKHFKRAMFKVKFLTPHLCSFYGLFQWKYNLHAVKRTDFFIFLFFIIIYFKAQILTV